MKPYNYSRFESKDYDLATFPGPGVGEPMLDLTLTRPDGSEVRLSDLLDRRLVLETGSVTCPIYSDRVPAMRELIARYPDTRFAVLYIREAHPGERIGPHASEAEKLLAATSLSDVAQDPREVLVDDLAGTAHQALGSLPDMVYVIGTDGRIQFRADWNDPTVLDQVLAGTAGPDLLHREHFPPARPSPKSAICTLRRGGLRAVLDFALSAPNLAKQHRRANRADR